MITDRQFLDEVRLRNRSLDSIRQSILQLSQQNLQLLSILAAAQKHQAQSTQLSLDHGLEGLPLYLAFYSRNRGHI